jgi:hypothetical protein
VAWRFYEANLASSFFKKETVYLLYHRVFPTAFPFRVGAFFEG